MTSNKVTNRGAIRKVSAGDGESRPGSKVFGIKPKFLAAVSPRVDAGKKKKIQIQFKPVLLALGQFALISVFAAAIWFLWPHLNRPVVQVEFAGSLDRVDKQELSAEIEAAITTGLLTLDLNALDAEIERIDWVYAAEVQKIWPQRLVVRIEEQQPVAQWGDIGYLAASGVMVESIAFEDLRELPRLEVMLATPQEALELFYGLNAAMLTTGIALAELKETEFGSWSMVLENGSEILLGKEELMERIQRVMRAWQKIAPEHIDDIETVDARYPNGIAVKYSEDLARQHKQLSGGEKT